MMVMAWWAWAAGAVVLGILEMVVPGYIFLGFACGAALVSAALALGLVVGWPLLALIFAVASIIAWVLLRRFLGVRTGQVKIWTTDINDD